MTDIALVTTTINAPRLLLDYARDAKAHRRAVKFVVTGDRKTPAAAAEVCAQVQRECGVACEYMPPAAQEKFMRAHPRLNAHLPWNCVQRRDVAILKAAADGAEVVVTIDDDNFLDCEDYFGKHAIAGGEATLDSFGGGEEWFNVCRFLREEGGRQFFSRGYGIAARRRAENAAPAGKPETKRVAVNAGFWLGDPDIDAAARLSAPVNVTAYAREENFFVAAGARTPFNSQNTALARRALPAYFLSPSVGRYDDIFAGYFVKRIADHLGDGVSFGHPLVRQQRNAHNLLHDLSLERLGTKIVDDLTNLIAAAPLVGGGYAECLLELCDHCERELRGVDGLSLDERAQMAAFFYGCRLWAELPLWE